MARPTTYLIYRITSPSGKCYIGITSTSLAERWRQHIRHGQKRRQSGRPHPFYDAIGKYGAEAFTTETIATSRDKEDAKLLEIELIAIHKATVGVYNVSPGGDHDLEAAHQAIRGLLADPVTAENYRKALQAGCLASGAHQEWATTGLQVAWREWATNNARAVWKMAYRASRIARDASAGKDSRFGAYGRLWSPSKRVLNARHSYHRSGAKTWHAWADEDKAKVHKRIAAGVKATHAKKSEADKKAHAAQLAKARANIDHDLRKQRQREGIQRYWAKRRAEKEAAKNEG